jgi:hypothetical protein
MSAKGDSLAQVSIETSTIAANRAQNNAAGLNGGVEAVSVTVPDCELDDVGRAVLVINRSIIGDNDLFGVGGPAPAENDLTPTVTKSFVYDNGGNGAAFQYQSTLFPGGLAPAGNPTTDPLIGSAPFQPALCSDAYRVGACSNDPGTVCTADSDCMAPVAPGGDGGGGGDECVAEGAGYLASPDINDDQALDGVDLNRFSTGFGAMNGVHLRYNPDADLDRNGMIDGVDLSLIRPVTPLFGQQCTP